MKRRHGTGFGDSLFENLAVFGFLVIEQRVDIHGLVELSEAVIDADVSEKRLHAEGARFVGNDGHDQLSDFRIFQHFPQHADEGHRGGNFAAFASGREIRRRDSLCPSLAAWSGRRAGERSRRAPCGALSDT